MHTIALHVVKIMSLFSATKTENPAATLMLAAWRCGGKLHVHMREDVMRAV